MHYACTSATTPYHFIRRMSLTCRKNETRPSSSLLFSVFVSFLLYTWKCNSNWFQCYFISGCCCGGAIGAVELLRLVLTSSLRVPTFQNCVFHGVLFHHLDTDMTLHSFPCVCVVSVFHAIMCRDQKRSKATLATQTMQVKC